MTSPAPAAVADAAPATAAALATVTMFDTIHNTAGNIPASAQKLAGYVTGSPDIKWTDADWKMRPHAGHVRIDQQAGPGIPWLADAADIETFDKTTADGVGWVTVRQTKNWASTLYFSESRLDGDIAPAIEHAGLNTALIYLWLADWSLTEAQARALIGTKRHDMEIVAVQWASPSSNPRTAVPGGPPGATLKSANLDLSVAAAWWHAAPVPPPPTWLRNATSLVEGARRLNAQAETQLAEAYNILHQHGG
jgi:hypothetical protein